MEIMSLLQVAIDLFELQVICSRVGDTDKQRIFAFYRKSHEDQLAPFLKELKSACKSFTQTGKYILYAPGTHTFH
jgi:hypothetical protein